MAYSTMDKLAKAYPDQAAVEDPSLAAWALTMADAEINAYVAKLYTLPLASNPPLLEQIANDIAAYLILTARPFSSPPRPFTTPQEASTTTWQARYNAAIAMLVKIGDGDMVLVGVDGSLISQSSDSFAATSNTMNYVPTMGEGPDQTFTVDRNKIDAELSRRT